MAVNCEKVVGDLFSAWTRLNLDEVMSHFAEDAVWDNVPMSPAKGKQAIREMTHGFMKDVSAFDVVILKSLHEGNVPRLLLARSRAAGDRSVRPGPRR
jgi:limonene-1,2-epoxide hydrolase